MNIRNKRVYKINSVEKIKEKLFFWGNLYQPVVWLDSNHYPHQDMEYDAILAVGLASNEQFVFSSDKLNLKINKDWLFGYFSYEKKSKWNHIQQNKHLPFNCHDLCFFIPEKIWLLKSNKLTALYFSDDNSEDDFNSILNQKNVFKDLKISNRINSRITKSEYLNNASKIKNHILRGDIYEVNYCFEYYAEDINLNSANLFYKLNKLTKSPFSAYFNIDGINLICTSPERFLKKINNDLISQPMKGTMERKSMKTFDMQEAKILKKNPKEFSENVMITDLVRNDISRIAEKGSVIVDEQCGVYPFNHVYQMISTVKAKCKRDITNLDIIDACFPMGSMTGAPKQRAMEIINKYEASQRGIYSGAVGYFNPNGDFDFNVVIRSIIYDLKSKYLSFHVGSAITAKSNLENEFDECELKAQTFKRVFGI